MKKIKSYVLNRLGITKLKKENAEQLKLIQDLQNQNNSFEKRISECESKIVACENKIVACENKIAALQKQSVIFHGQINPLEKRTKESENKIRASENRIISSENKIGALQKQATVFHDRINVLQREKQELKGRVENLNLLTLKKWNGLNKEERTPRIIVSLTSFPARINYVSSVLADMLRQTVQPDKIILYLSKEQFLKREADLPETLLKMKDYGVEIEWCDGDIKAYKKFLPALKEYPDDILIIVDDDLVYDPEMIEKLYNAHKKCPNCIIASRCHEIGVDDSGKLESYKVWKKECAYDEDQTKHHWFFTGGAGTLFPPHVFGSEIFDVDTIQKLCPWADDIWLNINAAMNRVQIINTAANNILTRNESAQEDRLEDINREQNDVQLRNVISYYKEKLVGTIYDKI